MRERALWAEMWAKPQAIAWEENRQLHEVALLVRTIRESERPHSSSAARNLVVRMMDSLGLTVPGLRANRWIIEEGRAAAGPNVTRRPVDESIRARLGVINGGA